MKESVRVDAQNLRHERFAESKTDDRDSASEKFLQPVEGSPSNDLAQNQFIPPPPVSVSAWTSSELAHSPEPVKPKIKESAMQIPKLGIANNIVRSIASTPRLQQAIAATLKQRQSVDESPVIAAVQDSSDNAAAAIPTENKFPRTTPTTTTTFHNILQSKSHNSGACGSNSCQGAILPTQRGKG